MDDDFDTFWYWLHKAFHGVAALLAIAIAWPAGWPYVLLVALLAYVPCMAVALRLWRGASRLGPPSMLGPEKSKR